MSNWKATMPRTAPANGKTHVLVALKGAGTRHELEGPLPTDQALVVLMLASMKHDRFLKFKAAIDSVSEQIRAEGK